jgi:4-hydroxy-tetrahydrodipicolinate synthase
MMIPGIYAASLTPLHEDLSCNIGALADHCRDLMERGCKGVVLFGTTGEGPSFSVLERERAIKSLISLGPDPKKMILGCSCSALEDAIQLAYLAVEQNCAAVLMAPPFFYKNVEDKGVIEFYRKVIRSVNHPNLKILLYHIPKYSGVPITLPVIRALREEFSDAVIGIKESEGNLAFVKEILSTFPDFKLFAGNELHISETAALGAFGAISGIANAYPELICSLFEAEQKGNELIQNIVRALKNYSTFPAIKSVVENQKGAAWHAIAPPLVPLDQEQRKKLITELYNSHVHP